jgi:hypothetical protein
MEQPLPKCFCLQISGRADGASDLAPETGSGLQPLITTSELVVGQNRFALSLLKANKLEGVEVTVWVYSIEGSEAQLAAELNAPYQAIRNVKQQRGVHRHADGTEHVHGDDSSVRGLYVAQISFTRAGTWGIEILAYQKDGSHEVARTAVTVLDEPHTPAIGSPAPRSRNLIASDVKDLRQIDTSQRPDPRLHQVRIADAIAGGKPHVRAGRRYCPDPAAGLRQTGLLHASGDLAGFCREEGVSNGRGMAFDDRAVDFCGGRERNHPRQIRGPGDRARNRSFLRRNTKNWANPSLLGFLC